jgi:hypothetical protein
MKILELQINLNLNTPDFPEKPILLTHDMIYNKELSSKLKHNKYPYFSEEIDYRLLPFTYETPYSEIIDFFFNIASFTKMYQIIFKGPPASAQNNDFIQSNILKMLTLLFPTTFPSVNNISTSYNVLFSPNVPSLTNLFRFSQKYSYLKQNGKTFTIIRSVWLNDVINNPSYRELIYVIRNYFILGNLEKEKTFPNEKFNFFKEITKFEPAYITTITDELDKLQNSTTGAIQNESIIQLKTNIKTFKKVMDKIGYIYTDLSNNVIPLTDNQKIKEYSDNYDDSNLKNALNTIDLLEPIINEKTFSNILKITNLLYNINQNIKTLLKINNDFFQFANIDINMDKYPPKISNKLKSFKPYTDVIETIKKLLAPNLISKNSELQTLIQNYSTNNDYNNEMIRFVYTIFKEYLNDLEMEKIIMKSKQTNPIQTDKNAIEKYIQTGINLTQTYYEIHLMMDLLEGQIDNTNKNEFYCLIKSETLGISVEKILYPRLKTGFYEITKNRISSDITFKEPAKKQPEMKKVGEKIGGKTIRKKNRKNKKKQKQTIKYKY